MCLNAANNYVIRIRTEAGSIGPVTSLKHENLSVSMGFVKSFELSRLAVPTV